MQAEQQTDAEVINSVMKT